MNSLLCVTRRRRILGIIGILSAMISVFYGAPGDPKSSYNTDEMALKDFKDDPFLWLAERNGINAMQWVERQNARTEREVCSDPLYRRYLALGSSEKLDRDEILSTGFATSESGRHLTDIAGYQRKGFIYASRQEQSSELKWQRIDIHKLNGASREWETLLQSSDLAGGHSVNIMPGPENRWIISYWANGQTPELFLREYDSRAKAFVEAGGFFGKGFVPSGIDPVKSTFVWESPDSLLVACAINQEELTASGEPRFVRRWRRGEKLEDAQVIYRSDSVDHAVGVHDFQDQRGSSNIFIDQVKQTTTQYGTVATETERRFSLVKDGRISLLNLPADSELLAIYQGRAIVQSRQEAITEGVIRSKCNLLALDLSPNAGSSINAEEIYRLPSSRDEIISVQTTESGLLVARYSNVRGRLTKISFANGIWHTTEITIPDNGRVSIPLLWAGNETNPIVVYESYLQPQTIYQVGMQEGRMKLLFQAREKFDASQLESRQFEAKSEDGTLVPYFVMFPRSAAWDGNIPTLMHSYGAHGVGRWPEYVPDVGLLWLQQGGAYVVANIRGGDEFGEAWHVRRAERRRTYEDFKAVAEDLIRRKLTSPRHLGVSGISNGGLLAAVAMTHWPDLLNAVVSECGALVVGSRLPRETMVNSNEFGSSKIPEEWAFLASSSPINKLQTGMHLPKPLIVSCTTDDDVHPAYPRRLAAKMEVLGLPFYYYETAAGGHEIYNTPEGHARYAALKFTYLARQLMNNPATESAKCDSGEIGNSQSLTK